MSPQPRVSLLTTLHGARAAELAQCAAAVKRQEPSLVEWIIVPDAAATGSVRRRVRKLTRTRNVRVLPGAADVSEAAATALATATGEFIAFLDHDDVLAPKAIARLLEYADASPDADLLYADSALPGRHGGKDVHFAKPDWSPERLLGHNYVGHVAAMRRSLVEELGGLRPEYGAAREHDLVLRVGERARDIVHIPQNLSRTLRGGADLGNPDPESSRTAVVQALARRGENATVTVNERGLLDVRRIPARAHKVSVVVPTRGSVGFVHGVRVPLVENAIRSVARTAGEVEIEWIVVYDTATDASVVKACAALGATMIEYSLPFNFADKCNVGALAATGDVLLLLNDDTQAISSGWLEPILGLLELEDVGAVGPLLRYESGDIQSAGHASHSGAVNNLAPGVFPGYPERDFGASHCSSERSGVTGAALAMRRELYLSVGGMSPSFPSSFNDVDLCFRLLELGYRVVWTPHAELFHLESISRDPGVDDATAALLRLRWGHLTMDDPYYPSAPILAHGASIESPFMSRWESIPW